MEVMHVYVACWPEFRDKDSDKGFGVWGSELFKVGYSGG